MATMTRFDKFFDRKYRSEKKILLDLGGPDTSKTCSGARFWIQDSSLENRGICGTRILQKSSHRSKFKLVWTAAWLQNRHQDFIYFPISNKERDSTFTVGSERFRPYSLLFQNTKKSDSGSKALELGFSCFALLRVFRVVWRFGIDLLGPKEFPLCFRKSLIGRSDRQQTSR